MPRFDPKNCWICGKPVSLEQAGIDEVGFPVHKECTRQWNNKKENETPPQDRPKQPYP
jgi:hypothetical protein